jgi:alpha-glucosidase
MWWEQAVIYQVYVRSFQDTNGDGIGDLPGVTERLPYIAELGAQAVWLSPIFPSPNADFGYDVSDFRDVEPALGTLEDLETLVACAHALGLRVLLDFVPCHTSTAHRWFREHPDYYVWADAPVNNWRAAFGGSAWGRDEQTGRYFLHSFFPEQADLNWRNPEVREQMTGAMRFWLDRGVDGFRLDALDRLMKDPELRDDPPASREFELPGDPKDLELEHVHSRNAPDLGDALQAIRRAVGDVLLVGEVYLPIAEAAPYLQTLDVVFNFEELFAVGDADKLRQAIESGLRTGGQGWVLSNHDFNRLVTRAGADNARAVALLLVSLPGPIFLLAGDELGFADAPMAGPEQDRNHRDPFRAPMVWDSDAEHGGFSTAPPWLTPARVPAAGVAQQRHDPTSALTLTHRAMALRSRLATNETRPLPSEPGTIVLQRGDHLIAVNLGDEARTAPRAADLVLEARPGDGADLGVLPAHGGWVARLQT